MKNIIVALKILLVLPAVFLLSSCSSTKYIEYSGNDRIRNGNGGTMEVVSGVDIWSSDGPSSKYEVIGVIYDQRKGGLLPMSMLKQSVAYKVKEVDGDAAVFLKQNKATSYSNTMYINSVGGATYSSIHPSSVTNVSSRYLVIKYFEE
ncbi:MAG: hypothetical protein COA45_12380 [Zetaproteobacteria bacterium]|nr:MAG: hypothetical protein COA45_12380 [Zetaproteobacteria bacterium]